jgi:glucose-6-phosphate isomerase
MFKKIIFLNNHFYNIKKYNQNLIKTKIVFNSFLKEFENNQIPLLESYKKDYKFSFSKKIIKKFSKYQNIIIIGMGGSILGTKSIYSFFKKKIKKKLFFFDNLDSSLHNKYKKISSLKNSCFVVVSKSGSTLETLTNFKEISSKIHLKNKLIVITENTDNSLIKLANKLNGEIIDHKKFIGGRYSVLSETGMFPAALMGLDLKKFKNLNSLIKNKNFISSLIQNVASIYTFNKLGVNNSLIFSYDTSLDSLGYWYQQLVAESLGKKEKGINPIVSFGPKDHHSLLQLYLDGPKDKFFTFFNTTEKENKLKKIINAQCDATKKVFKLKKIPFREITFNKKNEEDLGAMFTFFILETILLAKMFNVDPFNQPAVEQIKIETKKILK